MFAEAVPMLPPIIHRPGARVDGYKYCSVDSDSSENEEAGPALAAEDMGLDLDEDLEKGLLDGIDALQEVSRYVPAPAQRKHASKRAGKELRVQKHTDWQMIDKIKELESQNSRLFSELQVKNEEIRTLRHEALEHSVSLDDSLSDITGTRSGTREAKIIELAKKARRLNVALERERSQNAALSNKLKSLQIAEKVPMKEDADLDRDVRKQETELKNFKDKLSQVNRKLEEERLQNQRLKVDLRHMQKALVKEIGEDMTPSKILTTNSGWKGRAQQISMLKGKVQELTRQLQQQRVASGDELRNGSEGVEDFTATNIYEDQHRSSIKRMENDRKSASQQVLLDLESTRTEYSELRKKHEAVLARNKTLEKDLRELKSKMTVIVQKAGNDDQLVKALQEELYRNRSREDETICGKQKAICLEREAQVIQCTQALEELRRQLATDAKERHPSTVPIIDVGLGSEKELTAMGLQATIRALTAENEKLTELCRVHRSQISDANAKNLDLASELRKERRKALLQDAPSRKAGKGSQSSVLNPSEVDRLQAKLDLVKDENAGLKTTLRAALESKEMELEIFNGLLQKTRDGFRKDMDMIIQHVQKNKMRPAGEP